MISDLIFYSAAIIFLMSLPAVQVWAIESWAEERWKHLLPHAQAAISSVAMLSVPTLRGIWPFLVGYYLLVAAIHVVGYWIHHRKGSSS